MPTTREYASTDASAPTLSGTAGDLVNLLDKILVTGYGTKTAAGWSKPYTATNKAVFRMAGGNQFYLDVDDSGPGAGGAKEARLRAYEVMTAVATGTNPFPTVAQATNGVFARKSATADATTRAWYAVADDRTFWLAVQTGDSSNNYLVWGFGDTYSFLAGDNFRSFLIARATENSATVTSSVESILSLSGLGSVTGAQYMARGYLGTGASQQIGKHADSSKASALGTGTVPYPNGPDQSIYTSEVYVHDSSSHIRGKLRGIRQWLHPVTGVADRDTFSGAGVDAGKTFRAIKFINIADLLIFETSNWDTSS